MRIFMKAVSHRNDTTGALPVKTIQRGDLAWLSDCGMMEHSCV